jgi:hypothetical protein
MKEYQVFELDPETNLSHKNPDEVLFESDDLAEASRFAYRAHILHKIETAVWQPRNQFFRDFYKHKEEA